MIEDAHNQRKAIGNICQILHIDKYRLRPRFLRRNLRQILDSHEKLLRGTPDGPSYENMIASRKRTWGWNFPTTDMLRDYMNGDKPVLQLESLRLRRPGSKASATRPERNAVNGNHELDWIPDPQTDGIWPCTVSVAVWHIHNSKKQVHFESLSAKILQRQGNDRYPRFDVVLDKPLFIEVNKLFVVTESGSNGSRSWKRTTTASYTMEIGIQCQDSDDSAEFLSRLEDRNPPAYENAPSSEGILKATWENLPICPSEGQLLTLKRPKGHKSLELDYKLDTTMGWMTRRDYRLKTFNVGFHSKQHEDRQLPTPSPSDDMEKSTKRYNIVWSYRDSASIRTFAVKGLTCPLCRDNKDYHYFERLMLHCKNHHSHFNFDAEYTVDKSDSSTFEATVSMSVATQSHERQAEEEDKEMNWIAPNRPFNLRAHLRGDDDWSRQARPKSRKGAGRQQPKDRGVPSAAQLQPSRKRSAPDDVEDLPEHMPKRHRVPQVPGVSFYRTTSKQIIQPGEFIAESDDDVDESWLAQNHSRALEDLGITGAAKDFTRAFNHHLAREQSDSSLLVRDAIVRFARSYKDEFRDVQWQRLFRAKLNQLRSVGIIGDEIVVACVRLIQPADNEGTLELEGEAASAGAERDGARSSKGQNVDASAQEKQVNGESVHPPRGDSETPNGGRSTSPENGRPINRERKRWTSGKSVVRDGNLPNGAASSRITDSPMEGRGGTNGVAADQGNEKNRTQASAQTTHIQTCTCGERAKEPRGTIACADPRCLRKDYHMACVGLERRVHGWRCSECSA